MTTKKSAPLNGLIFRELYVARKSYTAMMGIFCGVVLLIFLVLLSFEYGNLANLPAETLESTRGTVRAFALFLPAVIFSLNASAFVDTSVYELDEKWIRFVYASPVSEVKYMGVKYGIIFVLGIVGYGISSLVAFAVGEIMGVPAAFGDYAIIALIVLAVTLGSVLISILCYLFKSVMAAIVTVLIVLYGGMTVLVFNSDLSPATDETELLNSIFDGITGFSEAIFPFSPLILIATVAIGFGGAVLCFKQRDRGVPKFIQELNKKIKKTEKAEKEA